MKKRIIAIMCVVVVLITCFVVPVFGAEGSGILLPRPDIGSIKFTTLGGIIGRTPNFPDPEYPFYIKGQFLLNEDHLYDRIETPVDVPVNETVWNISVASILSADQDPDLMRVSLVYSIDNEYIVQGEILFHFTVDPDNSAYSYLSQVYAVDMNGGSLLLWDQVDGMVLQHNPLINFGSSENGQGLTSGGAEWLQFYLSSTLDDIESRPLEGFADFTAWLFTAVEGFFNFPIIGGSNGFTVGHMFGALVGLSVTVLILKFIAGG